MECGWGLGMDCGWAGTNLCWFFTIMFKKPGRLVAAVEVVE